jgi:hypothetical protein
MNRLAGAFLRVQGKTRWALIDPGHDHVRRLAHNRNKEKTKMNVDEQCNKGVKAVVFLLATISIVVFATGNACVPQPNPDAVCGNGIVEQGEQCDPPNGTTCDQSCQSITPVPVPAVCGNGIVEEGEECDPPDGTTCDESCQEISAPEQVSSYVQSLGSWKAFSPPKPSTAAAPVGNPASLEELLGNDTYECTTTRYTVTDTPAKIVMYSPDVEILWPGALIQGQSHRDGDGVGSLLGLVIAERAPIRVSIPSLANEDNFRVVADPNQATVSQAIGSMIGAATTAALATPSSITFNVKVCHSEKEFALGMNVSGRYFGFRAAANADFSHNASETTVAAHFYEKMYEVVVEPPQIPGAFFSAAFTQEKLDQQVALGRIGPDNLPVYVSNVTYGRMMTFTLTSTASQDTIQAAINAAYSNLAGSVNVELDSEYKAILQEARIEVTSLGGDARATLAVIRSGDWRQYFTDSAPLSTARPLSYTFRNLGDNSIASVSETTEYDVKECSLVTPTPPPPPPLDSVKYFSRESEWRTTVEEQGGAVKAFNTTAANILKANEVSLEPTNNKALGPVLTFPGSQTGFQFEFWLTNTRTTGIGGLVFNDNVFTPYTNENYISIGNANEYEDDDFEIGVSPDEGTEVFAIGIFVDSNTVTKDEHLDVFDDQDVLLITFFDNGNDVKFPTEGGNTTRDGEFMGVVSPEPLRRISFDEDKGGDDIRVKNFRFGVR